MNSNEMIDIDLPSLLSIRLGYSALCGRSDDSSCLLIMRSNTIKLILNDLLCRSSKSKIHQFRRMQLLLSFYCEIEEFFSIMNDNKL